MASQFSDTSSAGLDDRAFAPAKIIAVVEALAAEGVSPSAVLKGTQLTPDMLATSTTRISVCQLIECYRNAVQLTQDPYLALRIGAGVHLPAYGMYGFAMISSTDARRSMEFAEKYHSLAAPVAAISFAVQDKTARWTVEPLAHRAMAGRLYAFVAELQIATHISLHRDTMGEGFVPREIALTYAPPPHAEGLSARFGCPVRFNQPFNQMIYDASWLDLPPRFGNGTTYAGLIATCDELLADLLQRRGIAGRVRSIILQDVANHPDFETTAKLLQTTPRTLRRQLGLQNTSFRMLLDEVRAQVASRYLQKTEMTNEDIAFALGFSDAANFRHAFRRWTQKTPRDFRPKPNGSAEMHAGL